ncbi:MAG: adenosylcobinamide-GDP ribazoletransferase [Nitrosomonadales bacterium]|nr:adenosylcobinamide-GDP ribazoletransferase [Nitrosomonadales bacterium]
MQNLIRQWLLFKTALMFFTRIPVSLPDFQEYDLNDSVQYFPLVGVLVGAIAALVFWLSHLLLPVSLAVLISMGASIYLTGAFHEDGLADAADGLGGGWQKEQVLTIMQDSRIGSYGSVALMMVLFTKFQALSHVGAMLLPMVLVVAHAFSRFASVLVIYTQRYVRAEGKSKPLATHLSRKQLLAAAMFGLLPLALLTAYVGQWQFLMSLLPMALVWWWFSRLLERRLGGYTGDCLGAMQQITELAFYIGVLVWVAQI